MHSIVAPDKGVLGRALTTNWVLLFILVMIVLVANAPVPSVTRTGIPTRKLAVFVTVIVVPLLFTPKKTGFVDPTRNFIKTQAASQ